MERTLPPMESLAPIFDQMREISRQELSGARTGVVRLWDDGTILVAIYHSMGDEGKEVIRHDADRPHKLYSVSPEGRSVIGESYREGVEWGHGRGDLEESSLHVLGMTLAKELAQQDYVENVDSDVSEYTPYYDLGDADGHQLDLAGYTMRTETETRMGMGMASSS